MTLAPTTYLVTVSYRKKLLVRLRVRPGGRESLEQIKKQLLISQGVQQTPKNWVLKVGNHRQF